MLDILAAICREMVEAAMGRYRESFDDARNLEAFQDQWAEGALDRLEKVLAHSALSLESLTFNCVLAEASYILFVTRAVNLFSESAEGLYEAHVFTQLDAFTRNVLAKVRQLRPYFKGEKEDLVANCIRYEADRRAGKAWCRGSCDGQIP